MGLFDQKPKAVKDNETQKKGARLITVAEPKHVISEQFRTLRTNIEFASIGTDELKTVMFTSPEVSDGKSTVSANAAVTWAHDGKKVLVIDADLRRSTVHTTFGVSNRAGLTTLLASHEPHMESELIQETFVPNLYVLTSGPTPPNPAELLNSNRMAQLMAQLREHFDIVVVDVPPVLAVTDAQVLLPQIDGVVLVVTMEKTYKVNIKRTVDALRLGEARILGFVTRGKNKGVHGYGYGYGYGYGDSK